MLDIFSGFLQFLKFDAVCIDNNVFRLHYKATLMILLIASVLVTSRQYIGDPIDCMTNVIPGGIMDTYCWIHGTFSVPARWYDKKGESVPHPGVAPLVPGDEVVFHKYYQWVCYVLFAQAGLFYIPRFLWKTIEGGRMQMLVSGMFEPKLVVNKEARGERISTIVKYIQMNRGQHSFYFLKYFGCEILNFINVIGQMFFMDRFLDHKFSTYGLSLLSPETLDGENMNDDPMARVFPKVTKCHFDKFGPSGTPERHDALCVLPLNIINEKIYIFLWFWFILVASITGIFLMYRFAVVFGAGIRTAMIQARAGRASRDKIADILSEPGLNYFQQLGDFFLLYLIAKNMDDVATKELINELHTALRPAYSNAPTLKASSKNNSAVE